MKNRLQDMPTKQKAMLGLTVVVVLIVIWQVVGLFGGGEQAAPAITPATPVSNMNANAPGGAMKPMTTANVPGQSMPQTSSVQGANQIKEAPIAKDQYLQEQEKAEKKYLKQLNDLEQLKIERQIEEMNQAIATAKLATVTAEKSTAEMLTKPVPTVPEGAYANQLVAPTRSGASVMEGQGEPQQVPPVPVEQLVPDATYTVISVSMQLNKWTAVIGAQGKLYNVTVGDTLPLDGSVVVSINKNGVVLKKDQRTRKVSMTTAI